MDAVETLLHVVIILALLSPVWLLVMFLVGWFFGNQRRAEAFEYLAGERKKRLAQS
mgnify:CR=1 FL=1|jgi:hypothetical protein